MTGVEAVGSCPNRLVGAQSGRDVNGVRVFGWRTKHDT